MAVDVDIFDVLQSAPVGTIILDDRDNQVLFWNSSVLAILDDVQGDGFARAAAQGFFHDPQAFQHAREQLAANGSVRNYETRLLREDGEVAWAAVTMEPITFEHNSATLIWYFDITESKRREIQLERSQDALLQVLDTAPTGAALTDGPQRISYWNTALLDIFARSDGDPATAIRDGIALAHDAIDTHGQGTTLCLPTRDNGERFVAAWKFAVEFEGAPAELIWMHDVTELRRAERVAQAATAAKSAFLATMSHEIRTPMNGVMVIADLLAETPLNDDQANMVKIVQQSAEGLLRVINDILDFSKLESSQLQVENIPFRLDDVLNGVARLLTPKAAENGLAMNVRRQGPDDCVRIGDPLRLRQVLLNLTGNAIKFTLRGSVTLDVESTAHEVVFRIIDTGVGISPDQMAKLFTPYQQADAATARNYGGTGLGLSISNALLTLMGGGITVESSIGNGSCFTVTLPLPCDDTATPLDVQHLSGTEAKFWDKADRAAAEANAAVILCAEDNPTNRDVLGRVLDRLGFVYDITEDGVQALVALDRSRHGLLVTDGHMPVMDGWELIRDIRKSEETDGLPRLPALLATADAVSEKTTRADPNDFNGWLTKPLNREQLEAAILQALPVLESLRKPRTGSGPAAKTTQTKLDLHGLIDLVGDAREDLQAVLQDFLTGAVTLHKKLDAALAAGDREQVILAAHAIKGSAGYAGARAIAENAGGLEAQAKAGVSLDTLSARFDALTQAMAQLPADIEASLAAHFG
jgi:signal transduction histidine kinase/CheY-like chemotaxis protein